LGHVGSNSILAIILFSDKEKEIAEGVVHRMVKRAVEMEGTVTGEHGVGLVKRDYLAHELGESTVDAMRRVSLKNADPVISIIITNLTCRFTFSS
jgi:D-lactate dehydrogenase (cytochrome)